MKIYLIGFMGCGKSTIGKRLATRCGFDFVDTDELFSAVHGCSVKDYFDLYSEEKFREEEQKILYQTQQMNNVVISVGGGTPCYQDNMQWILSNGIVVYIQMSANALHSRLANSKTERPLLQTVETRNATSLLETIQNLLSQRKNIYNKAHIIVQGLDFDMENLMMKLQKKNRNF